MNCGVYLNEVRKQSWNMYHDTAMRNVLVAAHAEVYLQYSDCIAAIITLNQWNGCNKYSLIQECSIVASPWNSQVKPDVSLGQLSVSFATSPVVKRCSAPVSNEETSSLKDHKACYVTQDRERPTREMRTVSHGRIYHTPEKAGHRDL